MDEASLQRYIVCANAFDSYDVNNDGALSKEELVTMHQEFVQSGVISGRLDIDHLLSSMDTDGDGLIQYDEFVKWLKNNELI